MKVGITGHQNLDNKVVAWVLQEFAESTRSGLITSGLTSLARGADQLFARFLHEHDIPYEVIIPCANYQKTFKTQQDRDDFDNLLTISKSRETLTYVEPTEEAFFAAGKRVVELSDIVIAIWNGLPAKGLGGTADVVKFSLQSGKDVIHLDVSKLCRRLLKAKESL